MDWIPYVEGAAAILAGWAAWLSTPRAPMLDGERLLKVALSVGIWAEEEEADPSASPAEVEGRWRTRLAESVPFHPAGRGWRAKVARADPNEVGVPAVAGERALVEALAELPTAEARWDRMFGDQAHATDPAVAEALGDPRTLGEAYDPRRLFGPDGGWEGVAEWSEAVQAGLQRRLAHVVVLEVGLAPELSIARHVGGVRSHRVDHPGELTAEACVERLEAPSDRLLVVVAGPALLPWLRLLADAPLLVDRVVGVVACGGSVVADDKERQELSALLRSESLLPELQRQTPVAVVDDVDPTHPLAGGSHDFVPDLGEPARVGVRWIDLGPLPVARLDPLPLGRALTLTAAFLLDA